MATRASVCVCVDGMYQKEGGGPGGRGGGGLQRNAPLALPLGTRSPRTGEFLTYTVTGADEGFFAAVPVAVRFLGTLHTPHTVPGCHTV